MRFLLLLPRRLLSKSFEEQRCSQLRRKVDITKRQLAKLSKRVEALAKEHTEVAEKMVAKQTELAQLEVELEEARGLIMQPTLPPTPPPSQAPRGHSSPRVCDVASSGMAVDAELLVRRRLLCSKFSLFKTRSPCKNWSPSWNLSGNVTHCGTNVSLSLFQAELLNDPEFTKNVKGLEGMLRVRERLGWSSRVCVPARTSLQSGRRDAGSVSPGFASVGIEVGFCPPLRVHSAGCRGCAPCPAENTLQFKVSDFDDDMVPPSSNAGCRGYAPCSSENTREFKGTDCGNDMVTPSSKAGENGESELLEVIKSGFSSLLAHSKGLSNSSHVSSHVGCTGLALPSASACARAACTHYFCSAPSAVVPLCMHFGDTRACINSCSDTVSSQGPRRRRGTKGGVSGPAEDLFPVAEVAAGVNFQPAGGVRGQVADSLPRWQPGTGTRRVREGAVTPSLHPEVPGIQFVSPGHGVDIRQSMGWMKLCVEPHSRGFGC